MAVVIGKDEVLQSQVCETEFRTWKSFHKLNLLTINTVKMGISKNYDRRTRECVQILEKNNFIAATKIKLGENLLKIIPQSYFLVDKMVL